MSDHPDENVKFKMEITKKFNDALTRQANEAVCIYNSPNLTTPFKIEWVRRINRNDLRCAKKKSSNCELVFHSSTEPTS